MNNFSYEISQNFKSASKKGKDVVLFFDENLMNNFISEANKDFDVNLVKSRKEAKNKLNSIGTNNIATLFTDSKYIFSSNHDINSYLIRRKKTNIDYSIIDSENFLKKIESRNFSFAFKKSEEKNISSEIKKNGKHLKKILYLKNNQISLALKINGLWKIYNHNELSLFYLFDNDIKPNVKDGASLPNLLKENKKSRSDILYDGFNVKFSDEYEYIFELSKWVADDYFYYDISKIINTKGNFININKKVKLLESNKFEEFIKILTNNEKIKGIEYNSIKEINNNLIVVNTNNGYYILEKEDQHLNITTFHNARSSEYDLKKNVSATITNIINWINNIKKNNTISKKDILKVSGGLLLFIILIYATFSLLFSIDNLSLIFSYIFSRDNLLDPWIYFIILAFIFTFVRPILTAIFMQKVIVKGKLNKEKLITYYIAGIFRAVASFLTGNYILSVFVWGWYLNKKLEIKSTSIVGAIGLASVVRALVYFFIGTIFMIIGTTSFFMKYYINKNGGIIWLFIISWVGFVWELFHKTWIFLLLLMPSLQVIVGNTILRFRSIRRELNISDYNNMYQNILLMRKTSPDLSWKKHRVRFIRTILLVSIPILVESFETVLYFDLVDSFMLRNSGNYNLFTPYYNFIDMSGLRLIASNIHNFPLFRFLPGRGMFISELGLNSLYQVVYSSAHPNIEGAWGSYTAEDLAQMTTFLTRLFNVYLPMLIRMIIVALVVLNTIIRRRK